MFVIDREFYIGKTGAIINDSLAYREVDGDADNKIMKILNKFITKCVKGLTENKIKLLSNFEYKTIGNLYYLRVRRYR